MTRDGHDVQHSCYDIGVTGIDDGSHEFLLCTARAQTERESKHNYCSGKVLRRFLGGIVLLLNAIP
jgi:hypothetical protein